MQMWNWPSARLAADWIASAQKCISIIHLRSNQQQIFAHFFSRCVFLVGRDVPSTFGAALGSGDTNSSFGWQPAESTIFIINNLIVSTRAICQLIANKLTFFEYIPRVIVSLSSVCKLRVYQKCAVAVDRIHAPRPRHRLSDWRRRMVCVCECVFWTRRQREDTRDNCRPREAMWKMVIMLHEIKMI